MTSGDGFDQIAILLHAISSTHIFSSSIVCCESLSELYF